MRTMSYAIVTTDTDGIFVLLGRKEWNEHISKRHPELNNFLDEIRQAIEKPDLRHRDPEDSRVKLHYREIPQEKRLHLKLVYLLVVIKYVNAPEQQYQKTGFVSSAYFLKAPKSRGIDNAKRD